jgi:hypothetical protein
VTLYGVDNVITLEAPPFAPATCHVVVVRYTDSGTPTALPDNPGCGYGQLDGSFGALAGAPTVGVDVTGSELPPAQQSAARQAIAAALVAQEIRATVPAGEYYVAGLTPGGEEVSAQATAPLGATEDLIPAPPSYTPLVAGSCGALDCGSSFDPGKVPSGRVWSIQEPLFVQWGFTNASGAQVGQAAFGPLPYPAEFWLSQQQSAWQVILTQNAYTDRPAVGDDARCQAAQAALSAYGVGNFFTYYSWQMTEKRVGPLGCTFTLDSSQYAGFFVWRFGVLLAADTTAHRLLPALPIAPPREVAEAGGP